MNLIFNIKGEKVHGKNASRSQKKIKLNFYQK